MPKRKQRNYMRKGELQEICRQHVVCDTCPVPKEHPTIECCVRYRADWCVPAAYPAKILYELVDEKPADHAAAPSVESERELPS